MSICKYYLPIAGHEHGDCIFLRRLKMDTPVLYEEVTAHMARQAGRSIGGHAWCLFRGLPPCDYLE
ncbi:MAG: hypothetical protein WDO69_33860 [Pseudomonadota bacterium]